MDLNKSLKFLERLYSGDIKILPSFLVLFLLNLLFFINYYGRIFIFVDTSREVYIPYAINSGAVLYKDIYNEYSPLSYYLNAFFTNIFNNDLNTFYILGFINSVLILWGLFLILRYFVKEKFLIFSVLLLIISACFYPVSYTGYIFPYSYSMVYELNCFVWALTALLYYLKRNENKFLYLSFFLFGLCICFKYEFLLFFIILTGILIYKKTDIKTNLKITGSFLIAPVICFLILYFKGVNSEDIIQTLKYMYLLSKTNSTLVLYKYLGMIPTLESLKTVSVNFLKFALYLSVLTIYTAIYIKIYDRSRNFFSKNLLFNLLYILCFGLLPFCISAYFIYKSFINSNAFIFSWLGLFTLILFLLTSKKILKTDTAFFIMFLSVIMCSFKTIFNISFNSYGTYFFPLLFICTVIYISEFLLKDKFLKLIFALFIFLISTAYIFSNAKRSDIIFSEGKITTQKGVFYTDNSQSKTIQKTLDYIEANTKKEDKLLVLPEGTIINYLLERASDNKYYSLIPPNLEIFNEDNIKNDLEMNLPDYIILQPISQNNYGQTYFCESFGQKICSIIPEYYDTPVVIQDNKNDFWLAIYKKREL